ncbi:hypothetical protein M427DRAFT_47384 [Gonapodya prolifera JEL478]|uniref:Uncharacterized protein n=1 Tax=Gonapodya prolifera (strain JEL478) TaxID=1344416 RepID=A0A139A329_GONPJ|nr:hypothetical protein M427DRAFT_47384 [Gonapodya prolifera JEL478]|eukprot:KXS11192.1 hypothetical protein M427DRAFT_47384 [Gonapodya prolifera JEL478]
MKEEGQLPLRKFRLSRRREHAGRHLVFGAQCVDDQGGSAAYLPRSDMLQTESPHSPDIDAASDCDSDEDLWTLRFHLPTVDRTLTIRQEFGGVILTEFGTRDGGLGSTVWPPSSRLLRFFEERPHLIRARRVLELGAGCGLLGIGIAQLGAKEVVLTDRGDMMELLDINLHKNPPCAPCTASSHSLDWTSFPTTPASALPPPLSTPFDVVVAAECLYSIAAVRPLLETVAKAIEKEGKGTAYMCGVIGPEVWDELEREVEREGWVMEDAEGTDRTARNACGERHTADNDTPKESCAEAEGGRGAGAGREDRKVWKLTTAGATST